MMKTQNSKSTILWKKLAIIPLMGGLIFLFANRVEAQTKKEIKKPVIKEVKQTGVSDAQMKEYKSLFKKGAKNNIYKVKDVTKMQHIYNMMSDSQRKSVKNIDDVLPPPPPRPVKIEVKEKKTKKALKEKKAKKALKVKEKKAKKTGWDLLEAQMHDPSLIKENKDIDKEEEIGFNWNNYEERAANIGKYRKQKMVEEIIEEKELKEEKEKKELKWGDKVIVEEEEIEKKEILEKLETLIEVEEIQEEREIPEGMEEEEIEISNFKIVVEKDGDKISMKCKKGCAWKDLNFDLKKNGVQAINKYGMTSMAKKSDSDFLFLMTNNNKKLSLRSLKGTAWKGLEFSINKDEKRQINQFGVQRF